MTARECREILRATAILFQCPPSFRPTGENVEAMRDFFSRVGNGSHYAVYEDAELDRLLDWLPAHPTWVMFNNIPRVKDAACFVERATARGLSIR